MKVDSDVKSYVGTGNAARACDLLALMLTEQRKQNASLQNQLERITEMVTYIGDGLFKRLDVDVDVRSRPPDARAPTIRDYVDRIRKRARL